MTHVLLQSDLARYKWIERTYGCARECALAHFIYGHKVIEIDAPKMKRAHTQSPCIQPVNRVCFFFFFLHFIFLSDRRVRRFNSIELHHEIFIETYSNSPVAVVVLVFSHLNLKIEWLVFEHSFV